MKNVILHSMENAHSSDCFIGNKMFTWNESVTLHSMENVGSTEVTLQPVHWKCRQRINQNKCFHAGTIPDPTISNTSKSAIVTSKQCDIPLIQHQSTPLRHRSVLLGIPTKMLYHITCRKTQKVNKSISNPGTPKPVWRNFPHSFLILICNSTLESWPKNGEVQAAVVVPHMLQRTYQCWFPILH